MGTVPAAGTPPDDPVPAKPARGGDPRPSLVPPGGHPGPVPRPVARAMVAMVGRRCFDARLPWEVQRQRLAQSVRLTARGAPPASEELGGVAVERLGPPPGPAGTVVQLHGGAYTIGLPAMDRAWAQALANRTGATLVLPDYRLAPEHPCPAAVDDVCAVVLALAGRGPIVLAGESAGGGLALAAALALRDEPGVAVVGLVLHCPWVDLRPWLAPDGAGSGATGRSRRHGGWGRDGVLNGDWLAASARAYAGELPGDDPRVSPLVADLRGVPPMVVQAAADDLLRPDGQALALAARRAGVAVSFTLGPRLWHDWGLQVGMLADADLAAAQAAAAVSGWLGSARLPSRAPS